MKKGIYAEELSRSYLEYLGISDVDREGKWVIKHGEKLEGHPNGEYLDIQLYDPLIRKSIPEAERTNSSGAFSLGIHRIVYAWYNNFIPRGLVIDHINNIKTDNRLENLQLFTPGENIWKDRECNTRLIPCKLSRPRKYYEDKLEGYNNEYQLAKLNQDAKKVHALRTNIAQIRGKLRYWDTYNNGEHIKAEERRKDLLELEYQKKLAKEKGDLTKWHQICSIIKNWDSYDEKLKKNILDTLLGNIGNW